ncbi:MAG: ABC transporter ATP-binding protein [Clostridia bacterium]|nr:ABC transporter ATP-binding protein [Clostridia bacterium]
MVLRAQELSRRYMRKTGQANYFDAVRGASLQLNSGEVTVLMGRSGSGKTTLLHMLSGLLTPSQGKVWLDDTDLYSLSDGALSRLRNERLGVVPQGRSAIDSLTVLENILLPGRMYGKRNRGESARRWISALGIDGLRDAYPAQLSGGELRRMAIARALAGEYGVLLADEPTGDLDDENTALVLSVLRDAAKRDGRAVLLVSHDSEAAQYADHLLRMDGGTLSDAQ